MYTYLDTKKLHNLAFWNSG